jgi:predicted thioesterase
MSDSEPLAAGLAREELIRVEERHTVSHTRVPVLGTPMMVGLMEIVSADLMKPRIPAGFTSVGYEICIKHKGPAFLGDEIRVCSKVLEVDGRKVLFEVRVFRADRVIGEGTHRRAVVSLTE